MCCEGWQAAVHRARKLPFEISTSWWKGLGQFRPAAHQGASGGGEVPFGGRFGRNTPRFGPKISISWSQTLSKFPKFRASGPQISTRRRACEPWQCKYLSRLAVTVLCGTKPERIGSAGSSSSCE
jgi:hypothetical protein